MAKREKKFDQGSKRKLLELATRVIVAFESGVVKSDDPHLHDFGDFGVILFDGYMARFTEEFVRARQEFTGLAARMLKAKNAHEKTIRSLCQKAGQQYVKVIATSQNKIPNPLEDAAKGLVETVLAEAGREYVHIEPNFLIRHVVPDVISLGRVRSMRTEMAAGNSSLPKSQKIQLEGKYPKQRLSEGNFILSMPSSVWVVDVAATKENVPEEAKWLIDVAISLMRLSANQWPAHYPKIGELESHPAYPTIHSQPHVTMEGDSTFTGGGKLAGWYEISADIIDALSTQEVQSRATALFDPPERSLAQRVE